MTDISFTVPEEDLGETKGLMKSVSRVIGFRAINADGDIAKVSIVGVGMRGHSGVAFRMFKALAEKNINILMISTSEIKISVIIRKKLANLAMKTLHRTFGLHRKSLKG
jgi:aspartate kinase